MTIKNAIKIDKLHLNLGNCRPNKDALGFDPVGVRLFTNYSEYRFTNPAFVGTFFVLQL